MADASRRRADAELFGMRPKIVPPAVAVKDFMIQGPQDHGVAKDQLFGIESPGLTSSLAIAKYCRRACRGMTRLAARTYRAAPPRVHTKR